MASLIYLLQKFLLLAVLLSMGSCRYISDRRFEKPLSIPSYYIDNANILQPDTEDLKLEHPFKIVQSAHSRMTRQLHGSHSTNPDGTHNLNMKLPLAGNDKNVLSAIGSVSALNNNRGAYGAVGGGLALDNINGHGLSVTKTHIPSFGDQLTGAARVNLMNTDNHNANVNAFATRNMPSVAQVPNFNTYGGSLDYMYKNKVGGSLGMSHTPLFQKTDYSAMGNMNLYRNPTSSLDFNAGVSRSVSPFIPKSSWQPSAGLSFTKYF